MARDYAKQKQGSGSRKTPPRRQNARATSSAQEGRGRGNGLRLYLAGLLSGVFLSFIAYLGTLPPAGGPELTLPAPAQPEAEIPKARFDFYTLLPEQTLEVEVEPPPVEPAADVRNPEAAAQEIYVLQAGSFRQREDADRRRAELLLLGLTPNVEETTGDNGVWFRVYLGPFDSHATMSNARGLAANQNIDTLLLKRNRP